MADDSASLLRQAGLVSDHEVRSARSAQALHGGTIPEHLVLGGFIEDEELTEFFRSRLLVKRVSPNSLVGIPEDVLTIIPRDMACRLRAMPVHIDDDDNLTVLFSDPSAADTAQEISHHAGLYVVRAIATQLQIAWCLGHYYDFISPLGETMITAPEEPKKRKRGITNEVRAMRKAVMLPTSSEDEEVSPEWIAARAEQLKRQLAEEDDDVNTKQLPKYGAIDAKRESKMIPRDEIAAELPAVVIEDEELAAIEEPPEHTTSKQKFLDPPPGADPDETDPVFEGSTRRLVFVEPADPDDSTQRPDSYVGDDATGKVARANQPDENDDYYYDDEDEDEDASTNEADDFVEAPSGLRKLPLTAEELQMVAQEVEAELETAVSAKPGTLPASELEDEARGKGRIADTARTQKMANPFLGGDDDSSARRTEKIPVSEIREAVEGDHDGVVVDGIEAGTESRPILLTRKSDEIAAEGASDDVVLLDSPKKPRPPRNTQMGVGVVSSQRAASALTETSNLAYTGGRGSDAVPADLDDDHTEPVSKRKRKKRGKKDTSTQPPATEGKQRSLPRSTLTASEVDDGWGDEDFGPPGSTIPPAYLGAQTDAEPEESRIPVQVAEAESAGVEPAEGKAKGNGRAKRKTAPPSDNDTARLTETVKELGQTDDRNAVFDLIMDYLGSTHERVAFFAVKKGKVCAWKHKGLPGADESAEVALDEAATFYNLVENQIPFHGSEVDPATADFLTKATGNAPEDIIAAPVAIGPRVIGVLYGDGPQGSTLFDQQVSMVTRSAGLALQRILAAAKGR